MTKAKIKRLIHFPISTCKTGDELAIYLTIPLIIQNIYIMAFDTFTHKRCLKK